MANQSQTAATKAKESTSSPIPIDRENRQIHDRLNDEISRRAYSLYEQNGSDGQDMANWLAAESQILRRIPEIRESSSWYTVNVPLQGFTADQIRVTVEPSRAIIAAEREEGIEDSSEVKGGVSRESAYLVAEWPSDVDPATASAYLKNDSLTLTVKRTNPAAEKSTSV
jgi:HSP20 family molecular chaperone IbpA